MIGIVFAAILTGILLRVFQSIPGMSQLVETAPSLPALNALPIQHDYFETKRFVKSGPDEITDLTLPANFTAIYTTRCPKFECREREK